VLFIVPEGTLGIGVMVSVPPFTDPADVVTTTSPVVVAGIVKVMLVALDAVTVAATPFTVTAAIIFVPAYPKKLVPVMVTLPPVPHIAVGVKLVIVGAGIG
jgi:hypothetical protein